MSESAVPARFPATRGDIVSAAMSPMLEMVLGSRLSLAERLDPVVLSRAVELLPDLEPVLGCWYDEKLRSAEWVRCSGLGESIPFSLAHSTDLECDAAAFHATPFDPRGPRMEVLLLRGPERDDLCVRFDHVAGDGWCAKEVTYLLAETYTRLLAAPDYVPTPRATPRPSHADVWAALTDEQREAAENVPPTGRDTWPMRTHPGAGRAFTVRTLTLEPERVAAIRAHAHDRGGTVNDALIAALVRSAASMYPPRPGVRPAVSVSADSRRFAPGADLDRISMLATIQTVVMDYRHGETFDEMLQHVIDGVKPHRACLWSIGGFLTDPRKPPPIPMVLRAIFGFGVTVMRATHAGGLITMNIGPFEEKRLAFGQSLPTSAVVTGPIPKFPAFAATISYYRDALTFWMGFREDRMAPTLVERYLEGIDEQLAGAVSSGVTTGSPRVEPAD